tara:strand:+ start:693 stop:1079 length:387 start_codon:yes stop_codon:yes gene_type:complete
LEKSQNPILREGINHKDHLSGRWISEDGSFIDISCFTNHGFNGNLCFSKLLWNIISFDAIAYREGSKIIFVSTNCKEIAELTCSYSMIFTGQFELGLQQELKFKFSIYRNCSEGNLCNKEIRLIKAVK